MDNSPYCRCSLLKSDDEDTLQAMTSVEQDGASPSVNLEQDNHQYHVNPVKDEGGSVNQEDIIDVTKWAYYALNKSK